MNVKTSSFLLFFIFPLLSNIASSETLWPDSDWRVDPAAMTSPECQNFMNFSTGAKDFLTEGLVVIKDGKLKYEYYDSKYGPDQAHVLWSVSKTITGALLGIAVDSGKISLQQNLNEFYPRTDEMPDAESGYDSIKIQNLFYLDTGLIWDEYYAGNVKKSPVLSMLYGSGHRDMVNYATTRPMTREGAGYEFNYSTGTPIITMGVLKKVYGNDYRQMPWTNLFNPIGMKDVSFEQDTTGTFVGGSSVFATPRDVARFGYLYLNHGMWNGKRILSEDWIQKTLSVSPGYLSDGTVINDITNDGVYGGSIWLNKVVKPGFGKPYPTSPDDMYLALGHFGQLMIVLPSQNMVIARTGYDQEYNSKVDEFVSRAISCFYDPNYPIGKPIPAPDANIGLRTMINTVESGIRTDVIEAAVAKSVCSCHFISKVDTATCVARSNVPGAKRLAHIFVDEAETQSVSFDEEGSDAGIRGRLSWLSRFLGLHWGKRVQATFDPKYPELGCTLL